MFNIRERKFRFVDAAGNNVDILNDKIIVE